MEQQRLPSCQEDIPEESEHSVEQLKNTFDDEEIFGEESVPTVVTSDEVFDEDCDELAGASSQDSLEVLTAIIETVTRILRVLYVDLIAPSLRNSATQLLHTLIFALPLSDSAEEKAIILPLFKENTEKYSSIAITASEGGGGDLRSSGSTGKNDMDRIDIELT